MTVDATLDFEKKRNRAVKYDRTSRFLCVCFFLLHLHKKFTGNTVAATVKAMKRISEIKQARQERFYELRMRSAKETQKNEARTEMVKSVNLIAPVAAIQKQKLDLVAKAKRKLAEAAGTKDSVLRRSTRNKK